MRSSKCCGVVSGTFVRLLRSSALHPLSLLTIVWTGRVDRLESEHLGNMDQYRVTREVPLPYSLDDVAYETDDDERTLVRSGRSSKTR